MDIRPFPPAERHEMFYKAFADIKVGEAFEFINDHDPKPLYYQMEAESKELFRWEYIENGPNNWLVKIQKYNSDKEVSIGELVANDLRKAEVFKKFNIDFCCGGKQRLADVVSKKQLDAPSILRELIALESNPWRQEKDWLNMPIPDLVHYLVSYYHGRHRQQLPELIRLAAKVEDRKSVV